MVKVSRVLHAGYILEAGGTRILLDPIFETPFSVNCYPFPKVSFDSQAIRLGKFEAVFISHYHDDHCSFDSLDLLDRSTPIYIFCVHSEMLELIRELGFKEVHSLTLNAEVCIGDFSIIPRRALDAEVDSILQINVQLTAEDSASISSLKILNVVDSWIDDETLELLIDEGPWDLILWPFQTMLEIDALSPQRAQAPSRTLPPEWIAQIAALNPRFIVPSSCQFIQEDWSWQRQRYFPISYAQFETEMVNLARTSNFSAKTLRLNPGTSIELSPKAMKDSAPLSWIQPIGDQNVDYTFNLNAPANSIAEISKRLGPLTQEQRDRVSSFCREELTARYSELECVEPYFDQPRRWQLDVYDSVGQLEKFHYVLKGNELTPQNSAETQGEPEWLTEIPASKLFNALENGEALNSLYIRINDTRFSARVEQELEKTEADLLNDPLLRVLYEGKFGTYQKAQLRKLKAKNEV